MTFYGVRSAKLEKVEGSEYEQNAQENHREKKSDNLYHVMNETTLKSVLELQSSRSQCYKKKQYMKMC